jgi:hypothetical protein
LPLRRRLPHRRTKLGGERASRPRREGGRPGVRFATGKFSAEAAAAHLLSRQRRETELRADRDAFRAMVSVAEAPFAKHRLRARNRCVAQLLGQERATISAEGIATRMCRDAGFSLPAARSRGCRGRAIEPDRPRSHDRGRVRPSHSDLAIAQNLMAMTSCNFVHRLAN